MANSTASITLAITSGTGTAGATLSGTKIVSATNGVATFSGLAIIGTVGNYTFRFSAAGYAAVDASAPTVLSAGPAQQLGLTTQPATSAQSGVVLAQQPVVQLRDTSGNAVSLSGRVVTAGVVSGSATLSGASATTNASGVATFTSLAITALAGGYTLRFSSAAPTPLAAVDAAAPTVVSAGAASQLLISTPPPATALSGIALTTQPVVAVRDGAGNPVQGVVVNAGVASGTVSIVNPSAVSGAAGLATFSGLTLAGAAAGYTAFAAPAFLALGAAFGVLVGAYCADFRWDRHDRMLTLPGRLLLVLVFFVALVVLALVGAARGGAAAAGATLPVTNTPAEGAILFAVCAALTAPCLTAAARRFGRMEWTL